MKSADVQVGEVYAYQENSYALPRPVVVLETGVTGKKRVFHGSWDWRGTLTSFKGIRVEYPQTKGYGPATHVVPDSGVLIGSRKEGIVEARQLTNTWANYVEGERRKAQAAQTQEELYKSIEQRLADATGVKVYIRRHTYGNHEPAGYAQISRWDLEKILKALDEKS